MKRDAHILIVEDDQWFAEQCMRTLNGAGFVTRHVLDGIAAIKAIDESLPDVIVLDVFLPGPNAFVLLHEMQSYTDSSKVPIVICTSSMLDIAPQKLAAYGVREVLDKGSMEPRDLEAAIKRILL